MKFLLTVLCLLVLHTTNAQVRIGIEAGEQFTLLSPKNDLGLSSGGSFVPSGGISIQIGSGSFDHIVDAPLGKAFTLETGLFLTNFKYRKTNIQVYDIPSGNDLGIVNTHNLSYLHIPLNYIHKFKTGKNRIVLGTGFFGAFNIAEKITLKTNFPQLNANNAAIIGTKGPNNVVAGVQLKLGIESGKLYTYIYGQRTLTNLFEKGSRDVSFKGYIFGARIGWFLR